MASLVVVEKDGNERCEESEFEVEWSIGEVRSGGNREGEAGEERKEGAEDSPEAVRGRFW